MNKPKTIIIVSALYIVESIVFILLLILMPVVFNESLFKLQISQYIWLLILTIGPLVLSIAILKQQKWAWYFHFLVLVIMAYSALSELIFEYQNISFSNALRLISGLILTSIMGLLWRRPKIKKWFFRFSFSY